MLAFLRLILKFYLTRTLMSMNRETILRMGLNNNRYLKLSFINSLLYEVFKLL